MRTLITVVACTSLHAMDTHDREIPNLQSMALAAASLHCTTSLTQRFTTAMTPDQLRAVITPQLKMAVQTNTSAHLLVQTGTSSIALPAESCIKLHNQHIVESWSPSTSYENKIYRKNEQGYEHIMTLFQSLNLFCNPQGTHAACLFYRERFANKNFLVFSLTDDAPLSSQELSYNTENIERCYWTNDGRYVAVKKGIANQPDNTALQPEIWIYDVHNKDCCPLLSVKKLLCALSITPDGSYFVIKFKNKFSDFWTTWWYNPATCSIEKELVVPPVTLFTPMNGKYSMMYKQLRDTKTVTHCVEITHAATGQSVMIPYSFLLKQISKCNRFVVSASLGENTHKKVQLYILHDNGITRTFSSDIPEDSPRNLSVSWSPQERWILVASDTSWYLYSRKTGALIGQISRTKEDQLLWKQDESEIIVQRGKMLTAQQTRPMFEHYTIVDITEHLLAYSSTQADD